MLLEIDCIIIPDRILGLQVYQLIDCVQLICENRDRSLEMEKVEKISKGIGKKVQSISTHIIHVSKSNLVKISHL